MSLRLRQSSTLERGEQRKFEAIAYRPGRPVACRPALFAAGVGRVLVGADAGALALDRLVALNRLLGAAHGHFVERVLAEQRLGRRRRE